MNSVLYRHTITVTKNKPTKFIQLNLLLGGKRLFPVIKIFPIKQPPRTSIPVTMTLPLCMPTVYLRSGHYCYRTWGPQLAAGYVTSVRLQAEAEFLPFATQLWHILTGRKVAGERSNTFASILLSPHIFMVLFLNTGTNSPYIYCPYI
jgi:hypothetical protein